jgi:hypothetical protein
MRHISQVKLNICRAFVLVPFLMTIGLAGCISGGSDAPPAAVVAAAVVAAPVVAVSVPITHFANAGGGSVLVTSANTLVVGDIIVISGTTSYNGTFTVTVATGASFTITAAFVADDATGVWTNGGGVIAACATTGATGSITLPAMASVASRFTGVAPLAVVFDATGTTATATVRPFHDLEYRWTFGDAAGSPVKGTTWANGSRQGVSSRNTATGAVAAHIFETPGTYVVNLVVDDGTNTVSNSCVQIAVQDPDVVFAGAKTVCIANSMATAGVGGCPIGAATPVGTADFDAALASCTTGKRCLFKGGVDTYVSSATGQISSAGAITLGSYGGTAAITSTNISGVIALFNSAVNDLRIMDLDIAGSGPADTGLCVTVGATPTNVTILRMGCHDIGKGIIIASGANITGSVIQDSHIYNIHAVAGGVGIFGWAINSAFLGNLIGPFGATAEHNVRLQPGQRVAISNNTITTPGTSGKQLLTVRALEHTPSAIDMTAYSAPDTQYIYVSDNRLIGGAASVQMFEVGPASIGQNNWISDVIADRNWIEFGSVTQNGLYLEAVRVTGRNNICNATGGAPGGAGRVCFSINRGNTAGAPVPDGNNFYNNTCYSSDASSNFACFSLNAGASSITNTNIKNNLGYAPAATPPLMIQQTAGVTGTTGGSGTFGNSSNADVLGSNPNFLNASGLFNTPLDFKLPPAGSYAIGGGVGVPVWFDFFLSAKPSPRDIGAVNH